MGSAARSAIGRVTKKTGDVGKVRQAANGTVSTGVAKRAAAAQMFSPELAKVGKDVIEGGGRAAYASASRGAMKLYSESLLAT